MILDHPNRQTFQCPGGVIDDVELVLYVHCVAIRLVFERKCRELAKLSRTPDLILLIRRNSRDHSGKLTCSYRNEEGFGADNILIVD